MNILFDNVDWNSTAGPHWFGRKLADHLHKNGHNINGTSLAEYQAQLSIVIASQRHQGLPLIQRLDGIYYDTLKNYVELNAPIKATYDIADGVVFQSEWSKKLVESFFDSCSSYIFRDSNKFVIFITNYFISTIKLYNLLCCFNAK